MTTDLLPPKPDQLPATTKGPLDPVLAHIDIGSVGGALVKSGWTIERDIELLVAAAEDSKEPRRVRMMAQEILNKRLMTALRYSGKLVELTASATQEIGEDGAVTTIRRELEAVKVVQSMGLPEFQMPELESESEDGVRELEIGEEVGRPGGEIGQCDKDHEATGPSGNDPDEDTRVGRPDLEEYAEGEKVDDTAGTDPGAIGYTQEERLLRTGGHPGSPTYDASHPTRGVGQEGKGEPCQV